MKKGSALFILCSLFIIHSVNVFAQSWLWVENPKYGSKYSLLEIYGDHQTAVDKQGNVYLTGWFRDTLCFGNDTLIGPFVGNVLLVKYNAAGDFLWVRKANSSENNYLASTPSSLALNNNRDVFITGMFWDTVSFGSYIITTNPSYYNYQVFIVKYDNDGNVSWAKQSQPLSNTSYGYGSAIGSDAMGNSYITGSFQDSISFDGHIVSQVNPSWWPNLSGFFLVKYDSNGNVLWVRQPAKQSNLAGSSDGISIAVDKLGNSYVAGDADSSSFGGYLVNQYNGVLVKYDANGNVKWLAQSTPINKLSWSGISSVAFDGRDGIYVTGFYYDTIVLGVDTLINASPNYENVFLAKYDTNGNVYWAKQGIPLDGNFYTGISIACDTLKKSGGYLIIKGSGSNPFELKFGADTFKTNTALGPNIFLQFDSSGNINCYSVLEGSFAMSNTAVNQSGRNLNYTGITALSGIIGTDTIYHGEPFVARWGGCCNIPINIPEDTICYGSSIALDTNTTNSYSWSPPEGMSVVGGSLIASPTVTTAYRLYVANDTGCTGTTTFSVSVKPTYPVSVQASPDTICKGGTTTLTAGGAYSYTWYPSTGLNNTSGTSVMATLQSDATYKVIGDSSGCHDSTFININVIHVTVNPASPDSVCKGSSITLTASGVNSCVWSPSTGLNTTVGSTVISSPLTNITYKVVGDSLGCKDSSNVLVIVKPLPLAALSKSNVICAGDSATLTALGGGSYTWSPSTYLNSTTGTSVRTVPLNTITYTLTADSGGCSATNSVTVFVNPPPTPSVCCDSTILLGQNVQLISSGGSLYNWTPDARLSCGNCANPVANPLTNTTYTVTVKSDSGCTAVDSIEIIVQCRPSSVCCDSTIVPGETIELQALGGVKYSWSPAANLSCDTCGTTKASPTETTTYTVVISDSGCVSTQTVTIDVGCGTVFIPNAFSPGQSFNNILFVRGSCISTMDFLVFDRWGNKVFESQNKDYGWDGTFKGQAMNMGTYIYTLSATLLDGTSIERKGNVTLVR